MCVCVCVHWHMSNGTYQPLTSALIQRLDAYPGAKVRPKLSTPSYQILGNTLLIRKNTSVSSL